MNDFTQLADLASERLGSRVIAANDEFFAPKENLLKESKPVFIEGKYTTRGKWMDGWETRRRRTPGHDWCIIRLGLPGILRGILLDTSFFKGNYPEDFSLEACDLGGRSSYKNEKKLLSGARTRWFEVLSRTPLKGDSQNLFPVECQDRVTHVRLRIYPDGGVARLRLHGLAVPDGNILSRNEIDLVSVANGGSVVTSSDKFFGEPRNLLMPGSAKNMGDGWETRRRRGPGHDWVIVQFGVAGTVHRLEVDTSHFKGNFPESCSMEICNAAGSPSGADPAERQAWKELLPRTKLKANHRHIFSRLKNVDAATHLRFNIYPDGGVARLRVFGRPVHPQADAKGLERFNRLSREAARRALTDCCGATAWVTRMLGKMPYKSTAQLVETANKVWASLTREDWLEAFRHHPKIGEHRARAKQSAKAKRWSAREQSVAQQSSPDTLADLAVANEKYLAKFGHIYLICAAGKTSEEILRNLRQRLSNDPEAELRAAADEQLKITRLRLEKLFST